MSVVIEVAQIINFLHQIQQKAAHRNVAVPGLTQSERDTNTGRWLAAEEILGFIRERAFDPEAEEDFGPAEPDAPAPKAKSTPKRKPRQWGGGI